MIETLEAQHLQDGDQAPEVAVQAAGHQGCAQVVHPLGQVCSCCQCTCVAPGDVDAGLADKGEVHGDALGLELSVLGGPKRSDGRLYPLMHCLGLLARLLVIGMGGHEVGLRRALSGGIADDDVHARGLQAAHAGLVCPRVGDQATDLVNPR